MRYILPLLLLSLSACQGSNPQHSETPNSLAPQPLSTQEEWQKPAGPPPLRELPAGMPTPPTSRPALPELPVIGEADVKGDVAATFDQYLETGDVSLFLLTDDEVRNFFGQGFSATILPSRVTPNETTTAKLEQRRGQGDIAVTDVSIQKLQLIDPSKNLSPFTEKHYMVHSARVHFMQGNEPMVLELRNGLHTDNGWKFVMLQFVRP